MNLHDINLLVHSVVKIFTFLCKNGKKLTLFRSVKYIFFHMGVWNLETKFLSISHNVEYNFQNHNHYILNENLRNPHPSILVSWNGLSLLAKLHCFINYQLSIISYIPIVWRINRKKGFDKVMFCCLKTIIEQQWYH